MESNANSIFENIFRQCFVNINIYWLTCSPLHINCIWAYNKNYYRRHLTGHFVSKQISLVSIGTKSLSGIAQQFLILLFSYFSRALVFPTFKNVIKTLFAFAPTLQNRTRISFRSTTHCQIRAWTENWGFNVSKIFLHKYSFLYLGFLFLCHQANNFTHFFQLCSPVLTPCPNNALHPVNFIMYPGFSGSL